MNDDAIAFAKRLLSDPDLLVDDVKASTPQQHENVAKALQIAALNPDENDFDVLVMLVAIALRRNERMPEWLATFAADVLEGKRERPTKKSKYNNWERDYKYWRATQEVAKAFDLPHYSNGNSTKTTAAEIVSHAAGCNTHEVITAYKKLNRSMGVK